MRQRFQCSSLDISASTMQGFDRIETPDKNFYMSQKNAQYWNVEKPVLLKNDQFLWLCPNF